MGKPGPKQVPVTARIQKSTKGGIVQPSISGMGSIAKMKKAPMKKSLVGNQDQLPANLQASIKAAPGKTYGSPAKQGRRNGLTKEERDQKRYDKDKRQYEKDIKYMKDNPTSDRNKSYLDKGGRGDWLSSYDNAYGRSKKFENNLYNYDKKNKSGSTEGYDTAKDYATAKVSGTYKYNKNENTTTPPVTPPSTPPVTPPSTTTVTPPVTPPSNSGSGGSNTKNVKITGRIGSDLRRKQYDAKGWAYDDTIKKPKPKPKSKPKAKAILENNKKTEKKPKLAVTPAKPTAKPTKKQVRKAKSVERKTERAAKARRKSVQALESGNLAKSRRLKRREARINKRIEKKKSGQASKAIEPK